MCIHTPACEDIYRGPYDRARMLRKGVGRIPVNGLERLSIACRRWRYTEPLTSKQALAIFHLRAASSKKWHVPHILNFLPLLLQAAVVLFFAGLVEFLLSLNRMVAIPAILLMGLSVLFLVATTILPTIQLFSPNLFVLSGDSMPTQCIYKSPQSWVFRRIFLIGIHIPVFIH